MVVEVEEALRRWVRRVGCKGAVAGERTGERPWCGGRRWGRGGRRLLRGVLEIVQLRGEGQRTSAHEGFGEHFGGVLRLEFAVEVEVVRFRDVV